MMKSKINENKGPINILVLVQWLKRSSEDNNSDPSFYDLIRGNKFWIFKHIPESKVKATVDGILTKKNKWQYTILPNFIKTVSYLNQIKRYDVVVSVGFFNGLIVSFFRKVFKINSTKHIIIDATVATFISKGGKIALSIFQWMLSPVDAVITFSRQQCLFWNINCHIQLEKVHFFPLSVDFEFWGKDIESNSAYIFSGGKSGRDYHTLLDAIRDTEIPLTIVAAKNILENQNDKGNFSFPDNVKFMENIPFSAFRDLLINSKMVVIPLQSNESPEGQTVLVEAMAAGKALIVTRSSGTVDYVIDGMNGILVEAGNPNQLKEKICALYNDETEINRIRKNAKEYAKDFFDEKVFAQNFLELVEKIASK